MSDHAALEPRTWGARTANDVDLLGYLPIPGTDRVVQTADAADDYAEDE